MSDSNGTGKIDFAARRRQRVVHVEELGMDFRLRAVSIGQTRTLKPTKDDPDAPILLLALGIVNDAGEPIYTTEDDIRNLKEMPASAFQLLFEALEDLHGASKAAIDETLKN